MFEKAKGIDNVAINTGVGVCEKISWKPKWKIEKFNKHGELYATEEFDGNLLLNEGINELLKLLIGGSATAYSSANAYIGVGDGTTAANATQTGLVGTNKAYAPMDATYPQVNNQTVTFMATFGAGQAAFAWKEFTVCNSNSDSGKNLNRKVEDHGTKSTLDTWRISCSITIS